MKTTTIIEYTVNELESIIRDALDLKDEVITFECSYYQDDGAYATSAKLEKVVITSEEEE